MFRKISFQISFLFFLIIVGFLAYNIYFLVQINHLRAEGQALAGPVESEASLNFQNRISIIQRAYFVFIVFILLFGAGAVLNIVPVFLFSVRLILAGIDEFKKEHYRHRIPLVSKNEFGTIADYLNQAMEELERSHKALGAAKMKAEMEKKEAETILEGAGDGIAVIDRNFTIVLWNTAAENISGWKKKEAKGRSLREVLKLVREHDRKENYGFLEDAMLLGEVRQLEDGTLLVKKDGGEIPIEDSAAPLFDENKKVTGAVVIFRDATKEREARSLRSDFAYASHQLRTPVNRALWATEAAMDAKGTKKIKEGLAVAHKAIKSVERLAEELITVSEIDQEEIVPKISELELGGIVSEVLETLDDKRNAKSIDIEVSIPKGLRAMVDKKLLSKAFEEILDNALEYNRENGKVWITAALSGDNLLIEIRDNGIGIAEEQHALIFTKFFRGNNVLPESVGAGLGLYIAQRYIKLLGGKLWFESKSGEGTTFNILLPKALQ